MRPLRRRAGRLLPLGLLGLLGLGSALAAAGCAAPSPTAAAGDPAGTWTLVELGGEAVAAPGRAPSLTIDADGGLSGFAGVNRFHGELDAERLRAGAFAAGPLAATRMAGPPEAMELETRFLRALGEADGMRVEGEALVLTRDGHTLLRLRRGP